MTGEALEMALSPLGRTEAELASLLGVPEEALHGMPDSIDAGTAMVGRILRALRGSIATIQGMDDALREPGLRDGSPASRPAMEPGSFDLRGKVMALLRERHGSKDDLCRHIGMHREGLRMVFVRDNCTIGTLRRIAAYFGVPVTHFLPADPRIMGDAEKDREIRYLRGQLRGYQAILSSLSQGE